MTAASNSNAKVGDNKTSEVDFATSRRFGYHRRAQERDGRRPSTVLRLLIGWFIVTVPATFLVLLDVRSAEEMGRVYARVVWF